MRRWLLGVAGLGALPSCGAPEASEPERPPVEAPGNDESGFPPIVAECGNGFVEADEECDDANADDDDDCTSSCQIPCGLQWSRELAPPTPASSLAATSIVPLESGYVLLGPQVEVTLDQAGNAMPSDQVALIVRVDDAGATMWQVEQTADNRGAEDPVGLVANTQAIIVASTTDVNGDNTDIRITARDPGDGEVLWDYRFDSGVDTSTDVGVDVAWGQADDVLVSGQVRAGEGDDDVWVASIDVASGEENWALTWTGPGNDMFSTDDAGPLTVLASGEIVVLAAEYVDFDTKLPRLLIVDPTVGAIEPLSLIGPDNGGRDVILRSLSSGDDQMLAVYDVDDSLRLESFDLGGASRWFKVADDFANEGAAWRISSADAVANTVVGQFISPESIDRGQFERSWIAHLDAEGEIRCQSNYLPPSDGVVPPSLSFVDVTERVVAGQRLQEGETALWFGRFRPPADD